MVKRTDKRSQLDWSQHQDREIDRLKRFLAFGTELPQYAGQRHSSIGSWLARDGDEPVRLWKTVPIRCVEHLWNVCAKKTDEVKHQVAVKVEEAINEVPDPRWPLTLAAVAVSLYRVSGEMPKPVVPVAERPPEQDDLEPKETETQQAKNETEERPKKPPNSFRKLALSLIPRFDTIEMLTFVKLFPKKCIKKHVKAAVSEWYKVKVVEDPLELIAISSKWGWSHRDVIRWYHVKVDDPLFKLICGIKMTENDQVDDERQAIFNCVNEFRSEPKDKEAAIKEIGSILQQHKSLANGKKYWLRMINTKLANDLSLWLDFLAKELPLDAIVANIPRMLSKFPNNQQLVNEFAERVEVDSTGECCPLACFLAKQWLVKNQITQNQRVTWPKLVCALSSKCSLNFSKPIKFYVIRSLPMFSTLAQTPSPQLPNPALLDPSIIQVNRRRPPLFESVLTKSEMTEAILSMFGDKIIGHVNESKEVAVIKPNEFDKLTSEWSSVPEICRSVLWFADDLQTAINELPSDFGNRRLVVISLTPSKVDPLPAFDKRLLIVNGVDRHFCNVLKRFFDP